MDKRNAYYEGGSSGQKSEYTRILRVANAKAKANAAQGLPEIIEIASGKIYTENYKAKHKKDAKYGWYRYKSRFALPVFDVDGNLDYYNVFNVIMVVRHSEDGKLYLYDIMNIKKKRAPFSSPKTLLSKKPISYIHYTYDNILRQSIYREAFKCVRYLVGNIYEYQ